MTPPSNGNNSSPNPTEAALLPFLATFRELVRTYQTVTAYSDHHIRELGLTPSQFDVIATLGNTTGMSMGEVAEKTLVTKGTLTGIIDRLEKKGLVRRDVPADNRRSFTVSLTPEGEALFDEIFPKHILYMRDRFVQLSPEDLEQLRQLLVSLRSHF
ncbi:MAG: MarR family transcriptional regulator [Elainellaceae cyanobacterium]